MRTTLTLIAALLLAPLAVSHVSAQTAAASQQQALKKHPELAVAGSALNKAFVAEVARRKQTDPAFFRAPDWPMRLADELTAKPAPAPESPPVLTTPPVPAVPPAVGSARIPRDPALPLIGAIRWDAWTGGWVTETMQKTLGPAKYHARLPWFADVKGDGKVKLDISEEKVAAAQES